MARFCIICGHELITEGNDMLSDIMGDELDENEDVMITYAHCPQCNCEYEMRDASNKEIEEDSTYVGELKIYQNNEPLNHG